MRGRTAPRRRRKQRSPLRKALALLLLAGAAVGATSLLPGAGGVVAPAVAAWERSVLGNYAPAVPVWLAGTALVLLATRRPRLTPRLGGFVLAFDTLLLLAHVHVPAGQEISLGARGMGGGVVAGLQVWAWRRLFGALGPWWGIAVTGLGALVLLVRVSPLRMLELLGSALPALLAGVSNTARWVLQLAVRAFRGLGSAAKRPSRTGPKSPEPIRVVGEPSRTRTSPKESLRPLIPTPVPAADTAPKPAPQRPPVLEVEAPPGGRWVLPPRDLLDPPPDPKTRGKVEPQDVARALEATLRSFGVEARCIGWEQGPVVTRYELQPAAGVKVQRITSLANDIALALAAHSVRIEAPIPGKAAVGIEVPNDRAALVTLRELLEAPEFEQPAPLLVALGKDIAGYPVVANLAEMPHLLIAGATGSGKSVMLNAIIAALLMRATPEQVRLVLVDPKRVELAHYEDIPHLLVPVIRTPKDAAAKLRRIIAGMERRYEVFARAGVRNIQAFNALHPRERERAVGGVSGEKLGEGEDGALPYVVVVVDELADLMMVAPAEFEDCIVRLAQMARATGIHLVVATQRPSVDVITGLIKANIPSRIAFAVSSMADSRTILDAPGAEKLLGRGDMLYLPIGASRPTRVQGAYVSDPEIERLVDFWKDQGRPTYEASMLGGEPEEEPEADDELLAQAARLVVQAGYGSVSLLQRKMRIGYVRAARLVDQLEVKGIVGPAQGSNPREVLVGPEALERLFPDRKD